VVPTQSSPYRCSLAYREPDVLDGGKVDLEEVGTPLCNGRA
jgi:hypothetical protein